MDRLRRHAALRVALAALLLGVSASLPSACATAAPPAVAKPAPLAPSAPSTSISPAPAPEPPPRVARDSLYARLGGGPAIDKVVDRLLARVAADERIKHRFVFSDVVDLRAKLVDFLCQATGGPCTYRGKDMVAAHKKHRIDDAAFGALAENLALALDDAQVPARERGEVMAAVAALHDMVVEVKK